MMAVLHKPDENGHCKWCPTKRGTLKKVAGKDAANLWFCMGCGRLYRKIVDRRHTQEGSR